LTRFSEPLNLVQVNRLTPLNTSVDVHQHLWPTEFLEILRARREPPCVENWTLFTSTEPPYQIDPAHHDAQARLAADDFGTILLSFSSPLGIEDLTPDEAQPLLDAWHLGVAGLAGRYRGWAVVTREDPDLAGIKHWLEQGFAGIQVPASWLATPAAVERLDPILRVAQELNVPLLVHPGLATASAPETSGDQPGWWAAIVDYPAQLMAAWWSWWQAGVGCWPDLRVCFAAAAGLAPAHAERFAARSGKPFRLHPNTFVDTSSYGPRGLDALIRVLGIDALVLGSDRPYAQPTDPHAGPEATHALRVTNPHRLLTGARL